MAGLGFLCIFNGVVSLKSTYLTDAMFAYSLQRRMTTKTNNGTSVIWSLSVNVFG